jgi:oligoribonuclease
VGKKNEKVQKMVWLDLEMTGLNPENDVILELAFLITSPELEVIAKGPEIIINHPPELFDRMDKWNKDHHTKSGLWKSVQESNVTLEQATAEVLDFLKQELKAKEAPLCGNSIWQDRRFLCKYMPTVDDYLNYRCIDVSSIKILANCWYDFKISKPNDDTHRALADIEQSIEELKIYRKTVFKST